MLGQKEAAEWRWMGCGNGGGEGKGMWSRRGGGGGDGGGRGLGPLGPHTNTLIEGQNLNTHGHIA